MRVWHAQARGCARPTSEPREKMCQNDEKRVQSLLRVYSSFWQGGTVPEGTGVSAPRGGLCRGEVATRGHCFTAHRARACLAKDPIVQVRGSRDGHRDVRAS